MINYQNDSIAKGDIVNETEEGRIEWLKERRTGIGGSDVSAVLGINPWKTPFQIWEEKTNKVPIEDKQSEPMYWGNVLEDVVAREYMRRTGKRVQRRKQMFRMKDRPYMIANIDRYIVNEHAVLECKTANAFMRDVWGDPESDLVPMQYLAQVQHYMTVTGYHEGFLAVLIGGNDFRIYHIAHNEELSNLIQAKCESFWNDRVLKDLPPDPINLEDVQAMYQMQEPVTCITTNEEVTGALLAYKNAKEEIKKFESVKDKAKFMITSFMKENGILVDKEGKTLATWKPRKSTRFDTKKFKEIHENLYSEFANESSTRTFLDK